MKKITIISLLTALLAFSPSLVNAQSVSDQLEAIRKAATQISYQLQGSQDKSNQEGDSQVDQCVVNEDLRAENQRLRDRIAELESELDQDGPVHENEEEDIDNSQDISDTYIPEGMKRCSDPSIDYVPEGTMCP